MQSYWSLLKEIAIIYGSIKNLHCNQSPSLSPSVDSPLKTLTQKHKDFYFTIILVAYINGIVERFGMGNYVLVVPGFSGQYLLPFIFSQDPQIDTEHNLIGLITISPGTRSFNQLASRF